MPNQHRHRSFPHVLNLVHVLSFVTLAEELHFGRAARRLNMTQPPLSRQIQLLEEEMRVRLVDRTSHSVALTPAGRTFVPEARALLAAVEQATQATRRAAQAGGGGSLTVGFFGAVANGFLPRLVAHARTEVPNTALVLKEMMTAAQLEALALGRLDLGLVRSVPDAFPGRSRCVLREPLVLALPHGHPLAARRRPVLSDLEGEPFIMYSQDSPILHGMLEQAFQAASVRPQVVQALGQAHSILSLVSIGLGLAIVPRDASNASFDNVTFRPITVAPGATVDLHAMWRSDNRNPALPAFIALLESMK
jgi:DNA-binding transcriptional LysR family regulator